MGICGEGVSSVVYKAVKTDKTGHLQEPVALKVFKRDADIKNWQREYASLARVQSKYCVRVHSFEWIFECPTICMEYVDGYSMSDLLLRNLLDKDDVLEIMSQGLLGLRDLWQQGLFHGDLSPKNIMISVDGQVKLLDFGLGNLHEKTRYGTPQFMHPDLKDGATPNESMDIYSLGQILNWTSQRFRTPSEELQVMGLKVCADPASESLPSELNSSSSELRERLARKVKALSDDLTSDLQTTEEYTVKSQAIEYDKTGTSVSDSKGHKRPKWSRFLLAFSFSLIGVAAFIGFKDFLQKQNTPAPRASIQIRTSEWKQIWLNGKHQGYTPANLSELEPGSHSIKWVGPSGAGEFVLTLNPGETKLLTDQDFREIKE